MKKVKLEQFPRYFASIPYAHQSPRQILDLILPEDTGEPVPLVIFIHGGGWVHGDKLEENIKSIFKIVSCGYAVATVEYRFSDEAIWPAQIYDVKAAVRFLKAHASEYGYKTDTLVAWGNSAGASLCQMLAATPNDRMMEDLSMGNSGESAEIDGLISWYGISNLLTMDQQCDWIFHGSHYIDTASDQSHCSLLIGQSVLKDSAITLQASAVSYVNSDFPTALFQHGTKDTIVPHYQSAEMVDTITRKCGVGRAVLELFDDCDHGDPKIKCDENICRCIHFLDEIYRIPYRKIEALPEILVD